MTDGLLVGWPANDNGELPPVIELFDGAHADPCGECDGRGCDECDGCGYAT